MASKYQNWLLAAAVLGLTAMPLVWIRGEYSGADGQAMEAVAELNADYKPWFQSVFQPPSKEIESLLFASQAAIGAGVMGYVIGLYRGRSERRKQHDESPD